jgi:hypothetical protein
VRLTPTHAPLTDAEFDRGYEAHAGAPGSGRRRLVAGRLRCAIRNSGRFIARLGTGPSGAGRREAELLRVIARMPEAVAKALRDAA